MGIQATIILVALANLALGGVILLRSRRTKANVSFALFAISLGVWTFALYFYEHPVLFSSAAWIKLVYTIVLLLLIPSCFYFALCFPKYPKQRKKVWLPMCACWVLILPLLAILWFTDWWIKDVIFRQGKIETLVGPAYIVFGIISFSIGSWLLAVLIKKYLKAEGAVKMQLRYIFVGLSVFIFGTIGVDVVVPVATGYSGLFWISPVFSLGFVIAVAYAITRYRLMDVRLMIKRTSVFMLTLAIVVGATIFAIWLMAYLLNYKPNPVLMIGGALAMASTVLFFVPLRSFLQNQADKIFYKKITSAQKALKEISDKVPAIIELDKLIDLIINTIQNTIGLNQAAILLKNNQTNQYKTYKIIGFSNEKINSVVKYNFLVQYFAKDHTPLLYEEIQNKTENIFVKIKESMSYLKAHFILPLISKNQLHGMIILGKKLSQEAYTKEDLDLLQNLANQTSLAIENANLYNQIKDLSENLQDKVDIQTKDIRKQAENIKALLRMKSELLSTISHQLRTPTSIFRGMLSMVNEKGDEALKPNEREEFIEKAFASADRLVVIINSINEANELQGEEPILDLKPVFIQDIIKDSMNIFKRTAKEKKINLKFIEPKQKIPKIFIDTEWIKSILEKLIDNSVWYTKNNGKIQISVFYDSEKEKVSIKIQDNGIGLTEQDKKILFTQFGKGRGAKQMNVNSSGLGLFIVKKVAEAHKGKVEAFSDGEDKGSVFTLTLPVVQNF